MQFRKKYHNPDFIPRSLTEEEKERERMIRRLRRKSSIQMRTEYIIYLMNKLDDANIEYDKPKFKVKKEDKFDIMAD